MGTLNLDIDPALLVTDVALREKIYSGGCTIPMPIDHFPAGTEELWLEAGGQDAYTFPKLKVYDRVIGEVLELLKEGRVQEAVQCVGAVAVKSFEEKTGVEKWAHMAVQMPGDWGPRNPSDRVHLRQALTSRSKGVVLEAMCGFTSYIEDGPNISEVIATDFCEEALERYDHPDRKRILFDMDTISDDGGIPFIDDATIGTVAITLGVDYLREPTIVYKEIHRILRPGGNFLIVGGKHCGYSDLLRQFFTPNFHQPLLENAGFNVLVEPLPYGGQGDEAEFHLIEARKPEAYQPSLFE